MSAPVWLVTGASSGVGRVLAVALAASGAQVILVARSLARLRDSLLWCGPAALPLVGDLSEAASTAQIAESVLKILGGRPLAGVIHAAGVMTWTSPASDGGWSRTALVNAVSPWRLTLALENSLLAGGRSRVLFVAGAHFTFQGIRPELQHWRGAQKGRGLGLALEAASAKVIMTRVLHRRWAGRAAVFAFHPGFVKSNLADDLPFPLNVVGCLAQPFLAARCASGEYLALSPEAWSLSGQMIAGHRAVPLCPFPSDPAAEDDWVSSLLA